ncbi:MAG: PilN domain-containing protein [Deltaproteobacteria bacterium]|nr:PilN domain-containing protein [Deltaproteobacteria bacterium]
MIKINLLPVRAARKKENIRRQVSIFFLCTVFGLCVMAYVTLSMNHQISALDEDISAAQAELTKYEAIGERVKKMKKELRKLEEKMDIIVQLEANRSGPVRFMDALTGFVVPQKMWLTALSEKQGTLKLTGMAADNKIIADFMTSLESSPLFEQVDLVSSKQVSAKKGKNFKQFIITCHVINQPVQGKPATS